MSAQRPLEDTEKAVLAAQEFGTPVRGYRWWRLSDPYTDPCTGQTMVTLAPAYVGWPGYGPDGDDWRPDATGWVEARCHCSRRFVFATQHFAFLYECTFHAQDQTSFLQSAFCGFHAWGRPEDLFTPSGLPHEPGDYVCGEVDLAGYVIAHQYGYRATHARPVALYGHCSHPDFALVLRCIPREFSGEWGERRTRVDYQFFLLRCPTLPVWALPDTLPPDFRRLYDSWLARKRKKHSPHLLLWPLNTSSLRPPPTRPWISRSGWENLGEAFPFFLPILTLIGIVVGSRLGCWLGLWSCP